MKVCDKPFVKDGYAYGCGQCVPCRTSKRREWAHRIMLEANCHAFNCFITLTYDDDHLPDGGNLRSRDLQLFMKSLRKWHKSRLRFYGVGEYGEKTCRPHYHLAVFGMQGCERAITTRVVRGDGRWSCCSTCDSVLALWGKGDVFLGQLEPRSSAYIAGYVTKKLGGVSIGDKVSPFARMSNRPGIGCFFMDEVASSILEHDLDKLIVDVPGVLRCDGKLKPIGQYLKRQLRRRIGRDEKAPEEAKKEWDEKMQPLREYAKSIAPRYQYEETLRGVVQDVTYGKRVQLKAALRRQGRRR